MGQGWGVVYDIYPREVGMRRAIPGRVVWGRRNTWTRGGLGRTEAWREGLGIVGAPISGPGLPRVHLEPRREGVLRRHGTSGSTVLVRGGSHGLLQGELISRRELGDNLIVSPWSGKLL